MKKKTFWILVGIAGAILLALVIWQTMNINALVSGGATQSAASSAASSYGGMVGGC